MYISKSELEQYLLINIDVSGESFVNTLISACQTYVEKYCGDDKFGRRIFEAPTPDTATVRRFNGNDSKKLYVGDLFDIESITIGDEEYVLDEDVFAYPLNNEDIAYEYLELLQPETSYQRNSRVGGFGDYLFAAGQANISIEGNWYYTEAPPADIKLAMLKLSGALLKENSTDNKIKEKKSEKLGDYSVDYQDISKIAGSLGVNTILDQYKRKANSQFSAGIIKVD